MLIHAITFLISFIGIWVGSGLAIKSVERVSRTLKISSFAVSFLILGLFTSMGELSVGINSIVENDPEIFVGNLVGASVVLILLLIPLLALVTNKIKIKTEFQGFNLLFSLVVIATPALLAMDGIVNRSDSIIALFLFALLVISIQRKKGIIESLGSFNFKSSVKVSRELLKILLGVLIIFVASRFIVEQTLYFASFLHVSPFFISLLFIALGTNIPELSLVVRSVFLKNQQVAFGDYIGSASTNTFLFGILTYFYGESIVLTNSYFVSLGFLVFGLIVFYYFARTKNTISRFEGLLLLLIYLAFIFVEIAMHKELFS